MLTLKKIKELANYTDSINVLQAVCNLSDSDIKYVIRIYKIFKDEDLNISQEFADIITENYITQRLINSKIAIEKLVESAELRKRIQTLTKEELLKYMEACKDEASNDLVYNANVIENYNVKDHLAIIDMASIIRTKSREIKDIFLAGINNKCPVDTIRVIIKSIDSRFTPVNKSSLVRLLTSPVFYELYPDVEMVEVISEILLHNHERDIEVLVDVALSGAWINGKYGLNFNQIAELVSQTNDNNKSLLEKEATYSLEYEDIVEVLSLTKDTPHLIPLFTNDFVREHLSYDQIISLIQEFDLSNLDNFDAYASVLSLIRQSGIKDSLYQDLRSCLAKNIYETTVGEYLATCKSISEFISTLEKECMDAVPIGPATELNLKLK